MKCPECDSPLDEGLRGVITCGECNSELFVVKKKRRLIVTPVQRKAVSRHIDTKPTKVGSVKVMVRKPTVAKPIISTPLHVCIGCREEITDIISSIKGKMLKGFGNQIREGNTVDPTTMRGVSRILRYPIYDVGRVCRSCQAHLTSTGDTPTSFDEVQFLPDWSNKTESKRPVVTRGMVEREDALQEIALEAAKKDARIQVSGLERRIAIQVSDVPCPEPEIHVNAFRKFMLSRKGGKRAYGAVVSEKINKEY